MKNRGRIAAVARLTTIPLIISLASPEQTGRPIGAVWPETQPVDQKLNPSPPRSTTTASGPSTRAPKGQDSRRRGQHGAM